MKAETKERKKEKLGKKNRKKTGNCEGEKAGQKSTRARKYESTNTYPATT
jgi:hypothetical protein